MRDQDARLHGRHQRWLEIPVAVASLYPVQGILHQAAVAVIETKGIGVGHKSPKVVTYFPAVPAGPVEQLDKVVADEAVESDVEEAEEVRDRPTDPPGIQILPQPGPNSELVQAAGPDHP